MYVFFLKFFVQFYKFGFVNIRDWSAGQIIAVFTWVPVIAQWIHWALSRLFYLLLPYSLFNAAWNQIKN